MRSSITFVAAFALSVASHAALAAKAAPPAVAPVEIDGLVSAPPAGWADEPAAGMRKRQFVLPAGDGDAHKTEVAVFFFGKGQGGSAENNITRWRGMFENAEPAVTVETVAGAKATFVELSGTYLFRARPMDTTSERRPAQRMIAVVFETPNGPYFIRLVGPDKTVLRHKSAYLAWVRAFQKPAKP